MDEQFIDIDNMLTRKFDAGYREIFMTGFVITIDHDDFTVYCSRTVCEYFVKHKLTYDARYRIWFLSDITTIL